MGKFAEGLEADRRTRAEERRESDSLKRILKDRDDEIAQLERLLRMHEGIEALDPDPPQWISPTKPGKGHHATMVALFSDNHFDEEVDPKMMDGINAYNREIAVLRLQQWAEKLVLLKRDYTAGVTMDGLVILMGGDTFSGDIHEELRLTNGDTLLGSVLFWQEQLIAAISMLADEFGKVHIACQYGNHGRLTIKPNLKQEARTNLDWFLSKQIESWFRDDDRVTFEVPEHRDTLVTVYDVVHCLNHGNETSGGGGIGGIYPPIMRMKAKKAEQYQARRLRFDVLVIGHWHQEIFAPQQGLIVNPAMKGYDEFAKRFNFRPERPAQLAWLVTPEYGITDGRPIIVGDRKAEGW